jgi:aminopeptidase YwaD
LKLKIFLALIIVSITLHSRPKIPPLSQTTAQYFELVRPEFNGNIAFEITAFVERFWRVAGNTGFNKSIYKITAKLEEAGYVLEANASPNDQLTYRIEKRALKNPTWEPVDASLTIVDNDLNLLEFSTNRNMIVRNSASTSAGGVVGEVVFIENIAALDSTNVKGKIVFAEMSPYSLYQAAIVDGGALGLITYDNPSYLQPEKNTTSIQFRGMPYDETQKAWGVALSYAAKEALKLALMERPIKVRVDITTKIYPSEELTVVANIKGSELPDESLVFSAHVQEPGANDNATGVGTQLEMAMVSAKLIKANKLTAKRTLTFLWGDEIVSTRRYIEENHNKPGKINWGISLDMVGEKTSVTGGSFLIEKMPDPSAIWTRGEDEHTEWGGRQLALEDMRPHYLNDFIIGVFKEQGIHADWLVKTNPFEGGSDHMPFLNANIPGLLLWHFTDQFYHTDNDRIDKVSQTTTKNVGTSALVSAYILINADETTAQQLIPEILNTAKIRLNAELAISKKSISEGNSVDDEVEIIAAWGDWYAKTLASLEDLAPQTVPYLKDEIAKSQVELERLTVSLIEVLKE